VLFLFICKVDESSTHLASVCCAIEHQAALAAWRRKAEKKEKT
jgi:hypothetical protein